jgi:arginyl-tRNA synthetase
LKNILRERIDEALITLKEDKFLPQAVSVNYQIDIPKSIAHGDYSSNVALLLAKPCSKSPRVIAETMRDILLKYETFEEVVVAGPGFLNFKISDRSLFTIIGEILELKNDFGCSTIGASKKVQIEFVSANPTGPLHVGHGRGAALGSALSSIYTACGFEVVKEYYVNDAGRQMDILAASVYLRMKEETGRESTYPSLCYQGDYVRRLAVDYLKSSTLNIRMEEFAFDEVELKGETDSDLDNLIGEIKAVLGLENFAQLKAYAASVITGSIREDLENFRVDFEEWYSEQKMHDFGLIDSVLSSLETKGHTYSRDKATWFRSAALGDEKDRVLIRENGAKTYFAADVAYHFEKFNKGFARLVNIWGADHHGYVARVRAALTALGCREKRLEIILVQFASLIKNKEPVAMSTRSGEFVTLRELVEEVGVDAARFFYLMRRSDQHLEFDLDLAVSRSNENPVYYVQYAHARICSILESSEEYDPTVWQLEFGDVLSETSERKIAVLLARYPEVVISAMKTNEPHQITQYLREVAQEFHSYYNAHKILAEDTRLRNARLSLIYCIRQVLVNGLQLLDISAPRSM